jgi:hypothetical protein
MGYYDEDRFQRWRITHAQRSHRMTDTELAAFEAARAVEDPTYTPYTGVVGGARLPLRLPFRTKTAATCRAIAKQYGARFDPTVKVWYLPDMGGSAVEQDAIAALNRFRLIAPGAGTVPQSAQRALRSAACSKTPSRRSGFVTAADGFCVEFPNGWMISVLCDCENPTEREPYTEPYLKSQNKQDTMQCAIWTGTEWQNFQSTGKPVRTVTPTEFASVLAYVSAQPAGADAVSPAAR